MAVTHGTFAAVLLAVLDGRTHREVDWSLPLGNGEIVLRTVTAPDDTAPDDTRRDATLPDDTLRAGESEQPAGAMAHD